MPKFTYWESLTPEPLLNTIMKGITTFYFNATLQGWIGTKSYHKKKLREWGNDLGFTHAAQIYLLGIAYT